MCLNMLLLFICKVKNVLPNKAKARGKNYSTIIEARLGNVLGWSKHLHVISTNFPIIVYIVLTFISGAVRSSLGKQIG